MQMEKPLLRVVITVHSVLRQFHISNLVFNICLYVTMDLTPRSKWWLVDMDAFLSAHSHQAPEEAGSSLVLPV